MLPVVLAVAAGAVATVGWLWSRGDGSLRRGSGERIEPRQVALPDDAFGPGATLLLFTSRHDDRSAPVREALHDMAGDGVTVAEVDLTVRGDLAGRYAVTRTPTVFALDGAGHLRARVTGAAEPAVLRGALRIATGSG